MRAQFLVLLWFVLFPHAHVINCVAVIRLVFVCIESKMKSKVEMEEIHCHSIFSCRQLLLLLLLHLVLTVLRFQLQKIVILHPKFMRNIYEKRKKINETTYLRQSISTENRINKQMNNVVNCECISLNFSFLANGFAMIDE